MAEKHTGFEATGTIDMDANDKEFRLRDKTPASPTATGTKGEICWDANYIYICTATNTWKKIPIATTGSLPEADIVFDDSTGHTHGGSSNDGTNIPEANVTFDTSTGHDHDGSDSKRVPESSAVFDDSTGHTHSGTGNDGTKIPEASTTFDDSTGHTHGGSTNDGTNIPEANVTFDTSAGHDHDGSNSKAVYLPSGLIVMWHGTIASIPTGWVICDGNNSTPDLLGRFVEGVATAATNPGSTGGATSKTAPATANTQMIGYIGGDLDAAKTHTHVISDIRPKYYDIAFLMKT